MWASLLCAAVPVLALAAWNGALWPHAQRAPDLAFEDSHTIAHDPRRPEAERDAAQLRMFLYMDAGKRLLEENATLPGPFGDNARALLQKLKR